MSEIKSESVSSLVDNYSPSTDDSISTHLVDNMLKDEHLSNTWQNYHLIGDVLRDEVPQSLQQI
jgi:sigma-E factor negative regulatory protein RseA